VILVDLVGRALLQDADDVVDVHGGEVVLERGGIERRGGEVAEGEEVVGEEELDHLAELEGVAAGAGVVAELALPLLGGVQPEEVPGDGGDGVEDAVAPVLELSFFAREGGGLINIIFRGRGSGLGWFQLTFEIIG